MTKWTRTRTVAKTSLATSLAVVAAGASGSGLAALYTFAGSDTLTAVMTDSIHNAGMDATFTYNNAGSGAGETAALANKQSIIPMSRNWKSSVIAATANPTWAPALRNVIGLDAAVVVQKTTGPSGYSVCSNLLATIESDGKHAAVNSDLGLILGGKDGVGDVAACRDQTRLDAIDRLTQCLGGVDYIEHFYRRDDRSGTADTFKERLRVQRFCNGRAPGVAPGTTTDNNMFNDDADPIRRACTPADGNHALTVCTLYPATTPCTSGAGCTQGFLVALSQNDPGSVDITESIGNRIKNDPLNRTYGAAGRAASKLPGTGATMLNNVSSSDFSTRNARYFLSRRLFVQRALTNTDVAAGGAAQLAAEQTLYDWMTNPTPSDPAAQPGRFNVDPLLVLHGFLPCTEDSTDPTDSGNLCNSQWPIDAAESTPAQCIPAGATGNASNICCSTGIVSPASPGVCPAYPKAAITQYCSTTADCVVQVPALTCQDLASQHTACCVGALEKGSACTANADCCGNVCTANVCAI